jgi:formylglycine-generating enzyme required for sulfatase activity
MKRLYYLSSALLLMFIANMGFANFINVQNTTLTGQNTTNGTIQIRFDLSWNNSWRDSINYDGAWVFVKYRIGTGNWLHATVNNTGNVVGTGTSHTIQVAPQTHSSNRPGAMIYRNTGGSGTFNATGIQIQWPYSTQSVSDANALTAQLRVFAIEMVFIPQGNYFVGGATSARNQMYDPSTQPIQITGTSYSSVFNFQYGGMTHRVHGANGLDIDGNQTMSTYPTDNQDYPTGWTSFWIMKYEISQGQYVDFLNTLTYDQQSNRVVSSTNTVNTNAQSGTTTDPLRYTIRVGTVGVPSTVPRVYITVRPDRANSYMSWPDGAAYSDWAGLRPLSELEYEKACRGFLNSVVNEYAWGTTTAVLGNTLSGTENGTETVTESGANTSNIQATRSGGDGNQGPLRVGIHATATSTRTQAGSSYFGVMDLTGNMYEPYVNVQHSQGRTYRGNNAQFHGDGLLTTGSPFGFADTPNWAGNGGSTGSNVTTTATAVQFGTGVVMRGNNGGWNIGTDDYRVGDRQSTGSGIATGTGSYNDLNSRDYRYGFRAGRSGW